MQQHFAPTLAFGTYQLSGTECYRAVLNALRAGFRHIDTASIYKNEVEVGAAIRESGISRQELVVTTKLAPQQQLGHESAIEALQSSLTRLGLEYVDCYLMHWPATAKKKPQSPQNITYRCDSWKGMCEAKALGLTRHIGVCNFQLRHFESLEEARLPRPDIHQLELHPLCRQRAIVEYCRSRGIILEAYSPLGSGDARLLDDPALIRGLQAATAPGMAAAVDKQVQHRSRACSPSTDFAPSLGQSFNNGESTPPSTIGTAPGGITTASSSAPSVSSSPREAAARALILWSLSQGFRPIVRSTNPVHMSQNLDTLRDFVYCAEAASALMRFDDPSDSSSSGNPLMTSATTHGPPSELRSMSSAAGSDVGGHQQRAVTSLVSIADLLGRANDGSVGPDTHMCWFADKVV